jgi:hypothetical protein
VAEALERNAAGPVAAAGTVSAPDPIASLEPVRSEVPAASAQPATELDAGRRRRDPAGAPAEARRQLPATRALALIPGYADSSGARAPAEPVRAPAPRASRLLEIVPGVVTWALILAPLVLSFGYPEIVAWFVLSFDFYWFYKAVVLVGSVAIAFGRIRRVTAIDWRTRAFSLADLPARRAEIERRIPLVRERTVRLAASGRRQAAAGGRREVDRLLAERREIDRLLARRGEAIGSPDRLWHVALIPTYTEPFEKLYETVAALARTDFPTDLRMVAIITRQTDLQGRENVARLRELFADQFLHFFHILDPLEPGIVVGKSSAMAYGGRWLYRELVGLGFDPAEVVVTDLDADYRVHPQYFGYLTYTFLTDPDRFRRLFQPVPMFHNNLWSTPIPVRLVAVGATHVQMWRSLTPEKLVSFSSYAVSLRTLHEVDYWATDAIPEDSRFYWKSFFRYSGEFRAVPLFIPMYGDAVRARSYPRTLAQQYLQIRRWAWGVTDIPYYIHNAIEHSEIPFGLRIRRLADLWLDHINWAIAPFVMIFGSNIPLVISWQFGAGRFASTTLGQNLPIYASVLLTLAFCCLLVLIYVEDRICPPRPASWGIWQRLATRLQWLLLPLIGLVFSNLPALDAQTRLMTGRYLEYRVTEKA